VENLPLEIREIDIVEIDNADCADAGSRQVKRSGRSESSRADAQDTCGFEAVLPFGCDLGHDEMTRVPLQFFNIQLHRGAALVIDDASRHWHDITLAQLVTASLAGDVIS
jgi:hypothetical protein